MTSLRSHVVSVAALVVAACTPGGSPPGEAPGTITGVVRYDHASAGTLRVAAFASFPPVGPPVVEIAVDEPTFPQPYQLTGLPPGRYFVLAMVDVDPDDGDRYRPRIDPGGTYGSYTSPVSVTTSATAATAGIDVHLVAPAAGSPWDR